MRARPVLVLISLCLAAGCGQRGPLYLRDQPPPGVLPPRPEPYEPPPYPKQKTRKTAPAQTVVPAPAPAPAPADQN